MKRRTAQFVIPVLLFFLMLLDSHISQALSALTGNFFNPVSHLLLIALMYSVQRQRLSYLLIVSFVIGFIYDSYYIGVLGIASAILPLLALLIWQIRRTVFTNRWTRLLMVIILVFLFEASLPLIESAAGLVQLDFASLVTQQLAPTLVLNVLLAAALQRPFERLFAIKKSNVTMLQNL